MRRPRPSPTQACPTRCSPRARCSRSSSPTGRCATSPTRSDRTPRPLPRSSTRCSTVACTSRRRRTRRGSSPPPTTSARCRPSSTRCHQQQTQPPRPRPPPRKEPMAATTVVHLLRHGEVHNPEGVLYGRRDGYHLSELGREMAQRVAGTIAERDIVHLRTSPLERAQETAAPLAAARGLTPVVDPRVLAAVYDARDASRGHEAVIVSHQLPIWITRLAIEKRSFLHDPRKRQCTLCSLTSLRFEGDELRTISYSEPAGDLIPVRDRKAPFSAGDAPEAHRP